jgi:hypothetical protein
MSQGYWDGNYGFSGSGSGCGNDSGRLFLAVELDQFDEALRHLEMQLFETILDEIQQSSRGRNRAECDRIFGRFTDLVLRYRDLGMTFRAAHLSATVIILHVLDFESTNNVEVHKGALFYDTGLAFFLCGDTDRCSYYLALANEEDVETGQVERRTTPRGLHNRFQGDLSRQLARPTIAHAIDFLNGAILEPAGPGGFARLFGRPLDTAQFDVWRATLGDTHHFEFFRILQELDIFEYRHAWTYDSALTNPYLLLRLAKVLAHAAQWFESYLTLLQAPVSFGDGLNRKLHDPKFSVYAAVAGNIDLFAGMCPHGPNVDSELRGLLGAVAAETTDVDRWWRAFRIAYIVRNSMTHQIDDSLSAYQDRTFVRQLIQTTLLASMMLRQVFTGLFP